MNRVYQESPTSEVEVALNERMYRHAVSENEPPDKLEIFVLETHSCREHFMFPGLPGP